MSGGGPKGSLLESILNAKPKPPRLQKPREVENANERQLENESQNPNKFADAPRDPPAPAEEPCDDDHINPGKRLKSMQSKSFYKGSSLRLQNVEERVLRFLAGLRDRIDAKRAAIPWRMFPTQQAAFDFADEQDPGGETLRTFSVELASNGKRKFLVTSYIEFWRRYEAMLPTHRHYYEIIRDGWPCHLYFDLEFKVADNPGRDGAAAVDATLRLLYSVLLDLFSLKMDDSWIIELDSSTPTKFSRHVIVRIPGSCFADNSHIGAVVAEVCSRAWGRGTDQHSSKEHGVPVPAAAAGGDLMPEVPSEGAFPRRCEELIFNKADGGETLLIDSAVYTRNRAFRLHLSSKAGSEACLEPSGRFAAKGLTSEQVFMAALVCNVPPEALLLRCADASGSGGGAKTAKQRAAERKAQASDGGGTTNTSLSHPSSGPSPNPELDVFIESVCKEGGSQGHIRSWIDLDSGAVRLYNIRGNRWCGNIGRQHRSNGIFYVVDLQQGVWYQKCYDPECRNYRSPVTPLPEGLAATLAWKGGERAGEGPSEEEGLWGGEEDAATWDEAALQALTGLEGG